MFSELGDEVHAATTSEGEVASSWVRRFGELIPEGGRVLDLACGRGRHARHLAARGFCVEALDCDESALSALHGMRGITVRHADVEAGPWPYYGEVFDAIVVVNYLWRPLLPSIINAIGEGGVLIYETFMTGNELLGRPSNPEFLLRSGELLDLVRPRMRVVAFEQGKIELPRPAVVQRICAVRARASGLPLTVSAEFEEKPLCVV